jgi:hypothetical protein
MERKGMVLPRATWIIACVLLVCGLRGQAQLLQTGPTCGQWINVDHSNGGDIPWQNPLAAQCDATEDHATAFSTAGRHHTQRLRISNFGLLVPRNATVTGVEVILIRRSGLGTSVSDRTVQLMRNGVLVGSNLRATEKWDAEWTAAQYGGPAELWGVKWEGNDINHLNFGVAFDAEFNGPEDRAEIDQVKLTVYYQRNGGTAIQTSAVTMRRP